MRRDPRAYLWDALTAADAIMEFTRGRSLDAYLADRMLRAAVERQFEIIGEALGQLSKAAPAMAASIPDIRQVIDFRNLLIHGYATVDHREVWGTIQDDLPALRDQIGRALSELGQTP